MLTVIEYGKDEYEFPALIALGCFDAIHLGHRELLKQAKLQAKINGLDLGVMMFRNGKGGKLVYSFEERLAILEQFNVKFVVAIDYTEEFMATAPLDFLAALEDKINVKAYMSGKDFRFGAQAKGKASTLKAYGEDEENGVWYMPVKEVDCDGERVSTTLIKTCLEEGNVQKAGKLLSGEFSVSGEVVKGAGRGTSVVGYPTVNLAYPEWKQPVKYGVYSVKAEIDGTVYDGVANFGTCPTFDDERVALEVYFENFSGDLYGRVLTIKFVDFIRDIQQFDNAEALSEQVKSDLNKVVTEQVAAPAAEPEVKPVAELEHKIAVGEPMLTAQPEKVAVAEEVKPAAEVKIEVKPEVGKAEVKEEVKPAAQPEAESTVEKQPEQAVPLTVEEKQKAIITSIEEDFDIDMSLIKALPAEEDDEPAQEAQPVEEKNNKQSEAEADVDYSNLANGFDESSEEKD